MLYPKPLEFKGSDKLAVDSVSSYETFVKLSTALLQSLDIVEYDGECLTAEQGHLERLASIVVVRRVRVSLDFTCNEDQPTAPRSKRALLREEYFGRCSQFRRGILDLWNLLLHK